MKKVLVLVILISLGLNIGLGARLWKEGRGFSRDRFERMQDGHPGFRSEGGPGGRGGSGGGRDSTFWRGVMERRLTRVADELGLDEEQAVAFKSTHQEASVEFLTQRGKVQEARRQLMEAASGTDFGVDTLRHLIAEVGRQQVKLDSMVTETMLQEMEILNEEQRREYMRILPVNRFGSRGEGPGGRGDRGQGFRRH